MHQEATEVNSNIAVVVSTERRNQTIDFTTSHYLHSTVLQMGKSFWLDGSPACGQKYLSDWSDNAKVTVLGQLLQSTSE